MRRFFLVAALWTIPWITVSWPTSAFAAASGRGEGTLRVPYEKYKLPNDMTVILHEDHSLPVACVNLLYGVGSKDEAAGRSGFAHLFEHLMFMGTRRIPGGELDRLAEAGGGQTNAMTGEDWTCYVSDGPSSLLPALLWIDADRLEDLGKQMNLEKLNLQRDIVRNERRQGDEMRPYGKAELMIPEIMYPEDHPYHHPVIGSHADLQAATVDDVKEFFGAYYLPCNASLVIAGDFNSAQIKPLIAKLFGTLPRGSDPLHRSAPRARLDQVKRVTFADKVQFARTTMVYHSPPQYQPGDAEMDLTAAILSDGKTSRLYHRLVYQDKLATDVSASQESRLLGSLFSITATAKPGVTLEKLEAAIDEVIKEFLEDGPTSDELKRHQASIEMNLVSGLQSIQHKAMRLNSYNFNLSEPDSFSADLDRFRNATRRSIRSAARDVLTPGARLILRVVPEIQETDQIAREIRPATLPDAAFTPQLPESFSLSNGIKVMHWRRSELPLVHVSLLLSGGSGLDDASRAGCAYLAAQMLGEGAGKRNALAFSDALQMIGASFDQHIDQESTLLGLRVLKRNLNEAMDLYADAVLRPRFEAQEWDRVKALHIDGLKQAEDEPVAVAPRVGLRAFFGADHPYGRPIDGTVSSVQALGLEDLRGAYARVAAPQNAVFFIAGDLTAQEAKAMLEKAFAQWKAPTNWTAPKPLACPSPQNQALRVVVVDKPESVQTVMGFFMPGPTYRTADRIPLQMLNRVLGGSFTSRLVQNLREKNGFTYGVRSRYVMGPSAGYLTAVTSVQAKVTGAALKEFLGELKRMRSGDVSDAEAVKTRQIQRTELVDSFQGLAGILATAQLLQSNGLAFSTIREDLASLQPIDTARLNALAKSAIPLDQALLVLVGDKQLIVSQIKDLGLPVPQELTLEGEAKEKR